MWRPHSHAHAPPYVWCLAGACRAHGQTVGSSEEEATNDQPACLLIPDSALFQLPNGFGLWRRNSMKFRGLIAAICILEEWTAAMASRAATSPCHPPTNGHGARQLQNCYFVTLLHPCHKILQPVWRLSKNLYAMLNVPHHSLTNSYHLKLKVGMDNVNRLNSESGHYIIHQNSIPLRTEHAE